MSQSTINAWIKVLTMCGGYALTCVYEYRVAYDINGACLLRRLPGEGEGHYWEVVGYKK